MGRITRFFECKEENCKAKIKRWANDNHQEEIQNCPNKKCERPTKACRSIYEDRLFGKFICDAKRRKKTCGKEWFSGNAYYNIWQECQRCHHRCTPVYLREHDKKERDEDEETKPHPDQLCQKCKEWKTKTGNPRARCIDYEPRERRDDEIERIKATYVDGANMRKIKSLTQTQLGWRVTVTTDELEKIQEETFKKKESENAKKNQAKNDKKKVTEKKAVETGLQISTKNRFEILAEKKPKTIANENTNPAKLQKSMSLDNCSWDSDNEEDRDNWFYTANKVYLNAPFRLQDYKEKLESGLVVEAPSCEPYRKLYFLHLEKLAAENQPKDKKKKARLMFNNLYSQKVQEVANKKKKLEKKEPVSKTVAKPASENKSAKNEEKIGSDKNQNKNQETEASDDDYWDSDNEEDRENWFYAADEVYLDAPFRLQDYKIKLSSRSVKEAPLCEPYRELYFLYLDVLAAAKQSSEKKKIAQKAFFKLYSYEIATRLQEEASLKNELAPNTAPKERGDNKENTTSAKNFKSQQNGSSLEKKMAALTVSSSQKATRTSTSSRRILTKLG